MNFRSIPLALAALFSSPALAQQAYSIDAEFVRPTFGNNSFAGVDVASTRKPFTLRVGTKLMYTNQPVTLWDRLEDKEKGAIVSHRGSLMLGASFDISDRFTIGAMIPMAVNSGGEAGDPKDFEAPGFGMQDIGVNLRLTAIKTRDDVFGLGIRAGLIFPSGRTEAYLGDGGFRPHGGLTAHINAGDLLVATDIGVLGRPSALVTNEDLTVGTELNWNTAFRYKLPAATRLAVTGQVLTKAGFAKFLSGQGENGIEALGGIEIYPSKHVVLDLSAGRGLTAGYGTTDLRVIGGLKVELVPKEPVVVIPTIPPPPVPPPPPIIEDIPEPEPELETEMIVMTKEEIKIKDKLNFIVNTAVLLDESRPVVEAVADVINSTWKIAHLEIVGHASAEGSYEYNYELSQGRARTIWQELIRAGVHPSRISYKGMGEVVPRDASKLSKSLSPEELEAILQDNRRVEFNIIKTYDEIEDEGAYEGWKSSVRAPWNGEPINVVIPEKPVEEAPPKEVDEFETDDAFDLDAIEDGMDIEGGE